jgi:hypothetical protein
MALAHVPDPDLLIRTGGEKRCQQLPAVAGRLRRAVLQRQALARVRRRGARRGHRRLRPARAALRQDLAASAAGGQEGRLTSPHAQAARDHRRRAAGHPVAGAVLAHPRTVPGRHAGPHRRRRLGIRPAERLRAAASLRWECGLRGAVRRGLVARLGGAAARAVARRRASSGRVAGAALLRLGVPAGPAFRARCAWPGGLAALWLAWLAVAQARVIGHQLPAVGAGAGVGGRHRRLFRRPHVRPASSPATSWRPSISPGKSWEGVWGGMVGVLVLAAGLDRRRPPWGAEVPSLYSRSPGKAGPGCWSALFLAP